MSLARLFVATLLIVLLAGCSSAPSQIPSGSVGPSASAVASAPASLSPPSAPPVPGGFTALSVTSSGGNGAELWVLGSVACPAGRCPAIAHTLDTGGTWSTIPAPSTSVSADRALGTSTARISSLRFATYLDGWAFGPDLWSTHDGGQTWKQVHVPGLSKSPVVALEAGSESVYAVLYDGHGSFRIASSPEGSDDWTIAGIKLPVGAGPIPTIQLVFWGMYGWVLQNDRTVVNGARLANKTWTSWQPPCASLAGPAFLAAGEDNIAAACDIGAFSTPAGEYLFVSSDIGQTFIKTGTAVPDQQGEGFANENAASVVVAGATSTGSALFGSFDEGKTWQTVVEPTKATFVDLRFTTRGRGFALSSAGRLLTTFGGRTWTRVTF